MKLKNKIVALALVVASAFGLAVSNRATKVEAAGSTVTTSIADYADGHSWVNGTKYSSVEMDANITVTATGTDDNTGKYYTSGENWRMYQAGTPSITFTANNGCVMSSIKITYTVNNNGVLTFGGNNITSATAVEVNAATATFGVGNTGTAANGQVRITAMEVTYQGGSITDSIEFLDTNVQLGLSYYKNVEEVAGTNESKTVTLAYSGDTTTNMTGKNDAETLGLDPTVFNVYSEKANGGSNHVGLNKAPEIRLYKNSTSLLHITFVDSALGSATIDNIEIVGTTKLTTTYNDERNAVVISNTTGSTVAFKSINITYTFSGTSTTITYDTFCNAKLRYVANVPVALVGSLDFADDQFGFELKLGEKTTEYTLKNANITVEEDGSYTFALIVSVPEEHYDDVVKVRAFVTTLEDGEITYLNYSVEDFSVNSLAQYYINNNIVTGDEKDALEAFLGIE